MLPPSRLRRCSAILALSLSIALPAAADVGYLEYFAGASFVPNQNLTGASTSSAGFSGSYQLDAGYVVGAAVGLYAIEVVDFRVRPEIAVDFRSNDVSSANVLAGQMSSAKGDIEFLTGMLNAYLDYAPADDEGNYDFPAIPYLGAGIGYGRVEIDARNAFGSLRINDESSVFVWNVMAGAIIPATKTVSFRLGYRYLSTTDPEINARVTGVGATRLDTELDAHDVTFGLRIHF